MVRELLDSDIYFELLRGVHPAVTARAAAYQTTHGQFTVSIITAIEGVKGFHKVQRDDLIRQFLADLAAVEVLNLSMASGEIAGRIFADLERTGQPIGRADPIIAAIAIQQGLPLVTGNTAHFQRVQALGYPLQLDNWRV